MHNTSPGWILGWLFWIPGREIAQKICEGLLLIRPRTKWKPTWIGCAQQCDKFQLDLRRKRSLECLTADSGKTKTSKQEIYLSKLNAHFRSSFLFCWVPIQPIRAKHTGTCGSQHAMFCVTSSQKKKRNPRFMDNFDKTLKSQSGNLHRISVIDYRMKWDCTRESSGAAVALPATTVGSWSGILWMMLSRVWEPWLERDETGIYRRFGKSPANRFRVEKRKLHIAGENKCTLQAGRSDLCGLCRTSAARNGFWSSKAAFRLE